VPSGTSSLRVLRETSQREIQISQESLVLVGFDVC